MHFVVKEYTYERNQVYTHTLNEPNKLWGLFENGFSRNDTYILCAIEIDDNQLDFTRLYIWDRNTVNEENIGFY